MAMHLPFTHAQFLDVFAAYNRLLWPAVVLLWFATAVVFSRLYQLGVRASRLTAATLALLWAWAGAVFHLAFFRGINPAATVFGAVFLLQAALLAWRGVIRSRLDFGTSPLSWSRVGLGLVAYALVYPAVGVVTGFSYPRLPTFGVPCPTTILTVGALLLLPRRQARLLAVIPLVWSGVGGSAAFLLDIHPDITLPVAGIILLVYVLSPSRRLQQNAS
jgi:hypothetical protein